MAPRPTKKTKTSHAAPTPVKTDLGGDDLEDNLLLDDEYLSDSPIDLAAEPTGDDDAQAYLSPDEDAVNRDDGPPSKKRRSSTSPDGSKTSENKKKNNKDKAKSKKKAKMDELELDEQTVDDTASLPVEVVLDRLSDKQKKALPDLTGLELDEIQINQSMIQDTSSVSARQDLLAFMKEALPTACTTLGKLAKAQGSPRIIVVAGAALRVADLCRQVKTFRTKQKDGTIIDVGKLFAKHFKLKEHAEYLDKTYVGIAVGTPNRIEKLLNDSPGGALKLTHLSHLILDTTHLDAKKRSLMDLPDARGDLFKLLASKPLIERLREGKMKIVLF
ncbi:Cms1p [Sporobolomyces koalae]|uniref:Cms1p n=1 Tax=Sporobolomyces koalae TaxID=500713 RepID=UPI0031807018